MNWADLESPLAPVPAFFVEPPDSDPANELQRVKAFRRLFRKHFPGARIASVPNGGQRGQRALQQAVSEGAAWGFPDMLVIGSAPFIPILEWKSGRGPIKPHQIEWLNWLHGKGHIVGVFRKPETAIEWLFERGFRA